MGESERRGQERGAEPVVGGRGDGRGLPRRDWGELGTGPAVGWGGDGGTRTCGAGGSVGQAPATAQEEVSSSQTQVWGFIGGSRPHWEGTFSHPNPTAAKDTVGGGGGRGSGPPGASPHGPAGVPKPPPSSALAGTGRSLPWLSCTPLTAQPSEGCQQPCTSTSPGKPGTFGKKKIKTVKGTL